MKLRLSNRDAGASKHLFVSLALLAAFSASSSLEIFAQSGGKSTSSSKDQDTSRLKPLNQINVEGVKFKEKWPKNFPVPPYPRNVTKTTFINTTQGAASASANIITTDKPTIVYDWYKKVLERDKWKVRSMDPQSAGTASTFYLLDGVKGYNRVNISVVESTSPVAPGTSVSVNWAFHRK